MIPLRHWTLPTILAVFLGLVARTQGQTASAIGLLEDAHATLAQADHDYNGHRAEAMKQIQVAARELTGTVRVRVHTHAHVRHTSKISSREKEAQSVSDAKLRDAENMLQQAAAELRGNAFQHINAAIGQLNLALSTR